MISHCHIELKRYITLLYKVSKSYSYLRPFKSCRLVCLYTYGRYKIQFCSTTAARGDEQPSEATEGVRECDSLAGRWRQEGSRVAITTTLKDSHPQMFSKRDIAPSGYRCLNSPDKAQAQKKQTSQTKRGLKRTTLRKIIWRFILIMLIHYNIESSKVDWRRKYIFFTLYL